MAFKKICFMFLCLLLPVVQSAEIPTSKFYVTISQNEQEFKIQDTATISLKRGAFTLMMPIKNYTNKKRAAYSAVIYPHPFVWNRTLLKESYQTMLMGMATYRTGYDCMYLRNAGHYLIHQKDGRISLKQGKPLGGDWFEGTWQIDDYQFFSLGKYSKNYKDVFEELDARNKWFESKECKSIKEFPFRYLYFMVVIKTNGLPTPKQVIRFRIDFGKNKH